MESMKGRLVTLRAGGHSPGTRIFAPPAAALVTAQAAAAPAITAEFDVTYDGFSDDAKTAFQAAVDVWAVTLTTSVTIKVDAHWTTLGAGILGSAGPASFLTDFVGTPEPGTWYPIALANKIASSDLSPGSVDITANFNNNFTNWYLGTDGITPPDKYDLMSVVLHELGHGLGFVGSMTVSDSGIGSWGGGTNFPIIYDRFTENSNGTDLLETNSFANPSAELAGQLESNQLFFTGNHARTANGNSPVQIYAPIVWQSGSSFSHLNEVTFPSGNANSLMSPQIGMGESIHFPGPVGVGVFRDLGW